VVGFVNIRFVDRCLEGGKKQAIIATTGHFGWKFVIEQTKNGDFSRLFC